MNKKILISLIFALILVGLGLIFEFKMPTVHTQQKAKAKLPDFSLEEEGKLIVLQGNSLLATSDHFSPEPKVVKKMKVVVTGYSSTEDQTDSSPFLTANGTAVQEGVVATNILPFGTKIKLPELYGDKIFVVEDRMSWKKGKYQIDIWFPSREMALEFGAKLTEALILSI